MNAAEPAVFHAANPASESGAGPRHIGIIMDGNGRWAQSRGLPRMAGHREGVKSVRRIVRHVGKTDLKALTLFSFSSENWSRPREEVDHLMGLLKAYIRDDLRDLHEAGVRIRIVGRRADLSPDIRTLIEDTEAQTAANHGLTLQVAFNYGSRDEIARAAQRLAADVAAGRLRPEDIDETRFGLALDTGGLADPDLIIRTSGEQRLSNFLLWQAAYAEFAFVPEFWPDFDEAVYDRVIADYCKRHRRFGGI